MRRTPLLCLVLSVTACAAAGGESAADWSALKTLGANSWAHVAPAASTGEVGLACDPDHDYVLRYGGCSSNRGTYEGYGYGNDLWLLDLRAGKWMMRRPVHMYGATERPINGCNRGFAYDSGRKVFWLCHGISSHGTGGHGEMTSYDPVTDRFSGRHGHPKGTRCDSTLMCYDPKNDLVLWLTARVGKMSIFDPGKKTWRISAKPAPKVNTFEGFNYDPKRGRAICLGRSHEKWRLGQPTFKKVEEMSAKYGKRVLRAWSYDAAKDEWTDLKPKNSADVPQRGDFASALDTKNDVFLLFGGAENYWGDTPQQRAHKYDT